MCGGCENDPPWAVRPTLELMWAVKPTPKLEKLEWAVKPTLETSAFVVMEGGDKEAGGGMEKAPWVGEEEDSVRPNPGVPTWGAVAPPAPASRRAASRRASAERPGGAIGVGVIVPLASAEANAGCRLRAVGKPPRSTPSPPEGGGGSRGGSPSAGGGILRSRR